MRLNQLFLKKNICQIKTFFFEIIFIFAALFLRHFSSAVEQLTRNEQVVGSNPMSGSRKDEGNEFLHVYYV